jgi:glycogen operon protein
MKEEDWNFAEGRFLAYVLAATSGDGEPLLVVFNAAENGVELSLPAWPKVGHWTGVLDTAKGTVLAERQTEPPGGKLIASPVSIRAFAGKP